MFVPCPHCGFLVALIVAADGPPQRCPRCDSELLQEDIGDAAGSIATAPVTAPPTVDELAADPEVAPRDMPPRPRRDKHAPSFVRAITRPRNTTGARWPGLLAVGLLTVVLLGQLLLAQRNELAADARWRPTIGTVCKAVACRLPPWHEPAAYTMLARSVQPASGKQGVLSVQASFRNDASWPQAWPALQLNLSDINGQTIARRVFTAQDYHPADAALPAELAPGQSASVSFDILEPASPIVAFTFDFR
ncbi:MAG TPA: DUF3426 domain-containing protein [Lysobacter sp.]|nr:DUF3426 domain-containing protein [Lysobacter sp.]